MEEQVEHGIPAIDRAMEIMDALAQGGALSIRDLAKTCDLARSTVYRTLNTLCAHRMVERVDDGNYVLGPRLLKLARAVPRGLDLTTIARPILDRLATDLGTSAKISILDGREALVIATAEAPGAYSITTQVGRRFPLHAGAASKLLLAFMPETARNGVLSARLDTYTARTIVDRAVLAKEFVRIRSLGYATDDGEYAEGVRAVAAPVLDGTGGCVAAVSVPYAAGTDAKRAAKIKTAVIAAGKELSVQLGA